MHAPCEMSAVLFYLCRLLNDSKLLDSEEPTIIQWYAVFRATYPDTGFTGTAAPKTLRDLRAQMADLAPYVCTKRGFAPCFDALCDAFKPDTDSTELLRYLYQRTCLPLLHHLQDCVVPANDQTRRLVYLSVATRVPLAVLKRMTLPDSPLVRKGIIHERGDLSLTSMVAYLIKTRCESPTEIKLSLIGNVLTASLTPEHFRHLGDNVQLLSALLTAATKEQTVGMNILLYGTPGTGKTELAKTLARAAGANLYDLPKLDKADKYARIDQLAMAQNILAGDKDSIILFDHAEDVFFSPHKWLPAEISKLYFARMLESNRVPVIWVTSRVYDMDFAYLSRFSYPLEVTRPDKETRLAMWESICTKNSLTLTADELGGLAAQYDVDPALIESAAANAASLAKTIPAVSVINKTIDSLIKAAGKPPQQAAQTAANAPAAPADAGASVPFDETLLNTDIDLADLTERLAAKRAKRFSLCLYGASGTGKSAFARHLADRLGLKVIRKRASDIKAPFVGQTEQNIAAAFTEACNANAVLVFDEADSFLRSRQKADRAWEASAVNEMLTWMESHPLPFVCTTNLMDDMDEASLRRFTFKVRYDYLTPAQAASAFARFFGCQPQGSLDHLTHLTPGDFALVKVNADIMDITDPKELVCLLEREQNAKPVASVERKPAIGFGTK